MLNLIYIVQIVMDSWYCSGLEIRNLRALISTVSNDNRKRQAQNVPYLYKLGTQTVLACVLLVSFPMPY